MESMFSKFEEAHRYSYETALQEIKNGAKESHWMWYIFPQLAGLGHSETAEHYAIHSLEEARDYLRQPTLKQHLIEISQAVYDLNAKDIADVFGYPDTLKFRSSMTLFTLADPTIEIFNKNLTRYFNGRPCPYTTEQLNE